MRTNVGFMKSVSEVNFGRGACGLHMSCLFGGLCVDCAGAQFLYGYIWRNQALDTLWDFCGRGRRTYLSKGLLVGWLGCVSLGQILMVEP